MQNSIQNQELNDVANPTDKNEITKRQNKKVIYTCPMHPEIQQDGPGACPKCGMALEPKDGVNSNAIQKSKDIKDDNSELENMQIRFVVSAILSAPLFFYSMSDLLPNNPIKG